MTTATDPSTHTISADLAEQLSQAIIRGEIAQGSKLSEPELAKRFGVSRGPLREAIVRLEGMGLVTRQPNVGARVVKMSTADVAETFAIREALEGMAARLAAERASEEELQELNRLLDSHEAILSENAEAHYADQEGNYDFHNRIIRASRNAQLTTLLSEELYARIRMYRQQTADHRTDPRQALREHRAILDAICNREGDLAEMLMRRHITRSQRVLEKFLLAGQP